MKGCGRSDLQVKFYELSKTRSDPLNNDLFFAGSGNVHVLGQRRRYSLQYGNKRKEFRSTKGNYSRNPEGSGKVEGKSDLEV